MDLSIVIPAYNESKRLPETLQAVKQYWRGTPNTFEIIVADDGSTDRTGLVARRHLAKVLRLPHHGKGHAVKEGVLASRGDWILVADADNSVPIETFDKLWQKRHSAPIIIASRFLEESRLQSLSPIRIVTSKLANIGARILLGLSQADTQCGFKLFRGREAKRIFAKTVIPGFGFDLEVLAIAQGLGFRIIEVPIVWRDARRPQLRAMRSLLAAGFELLQVLWNLERRRYGELPHESRTSRQFIKFSFVGILNFLVDLAVLNLLVRYAGLPPLLAGTLSIVVAMIHSFIWNHSWVFRQATAGKPIVVEFWQFFLVQGVGNGLHWLIFAALTLLGENYNLAKVVAVVGSTVWNFTGNKWWVFRR